MKRELENQIEELKEDLDAEKGSRVKAEKQRKATSEVCGIGDDGDCGDDDGCDDDDYMMMMMMMMVI